MRLARLLGTLLVAAATCRTLAATPEVAGTYDTPLGRVRVAGDGTTFTGTLEAPRGTCRFEKGSEVLRATLLDDSLAGEMRLCVAGAGCGAEAWARGVLLVGPAGLSGALHLPKGCRGPVGRAGGVTFARVQAGSKAARPAATPRSRRERARAIMRDGAAWLHEGNFERARARFEEAIGIDPRIPEAYNGVGVTWRMRDDLERALGWYKKALAVDPDFGDAYYNMACVYALQGREELALRYLQIAAMNGYATAEGIDADPDLASLKDAPAYRALLRARM